MARSKSTLSGSKPALSVTMVKTTPTNPEHGVEFTIGRNLARRMLKHLSEEFELESRRVRPSLRAALKQWPRHNTITFTVDEEDLDGYIAIQLTCMELVFLKQNMF